MHLVDTTLFYSPTSGGVKRYLTAKHDWLRANTSWEHSMLVPGTEERIERTIGADRMQIALLRADLRAWLVAHEVEPDCRDAVLLACSEAVANAIEHGYRDDPLGEVDVVATVSAEAVDVTVAHHGVWAEPEPGSPRGRGVQLIRQVMDQSTFDHSDGTTVTMRRIRRETRR